MIESLVRYVQPELCWDIGGPCTNVFSASLHIAFKCTNRVVVAVGGLFDDGVEIISKGLDKMLL